MGGGNAKAADVNDEESVGTPDMKGIVPGTERTPVQILQSSGSARHFTATAPMLMLAFCSALS